MGREFFLIVQPESLSHRPTSLRFVSRTTPLTPCASPFTHITPEASHHFAFARLLEAHHVTCSVRAACGCADNAAAESFFGVLKCERVNRRHYRTRIEARADIFDYIGGVAIHASGGG